MLYNGYENRKKKKKKKKKRKKKNGVGHVDNRPSKE